MKSLYPRRRSWTAIPRPEKPLPMMRTLVVMGSVIPGSVAVAADLALEDGIVKIS